MTAGKHLSFQAVFMKILSGKVTREKHKESIPGPEVEHMPSHTPSGFVESLRNAGWSTTDASLWLMRLFLPLHSVFAGIFTPFPKLSKYLMSPMEGTIEDGEGITGVFFVLQNSNFSSQHRLIHRYNQRVTLINVITGPQGSNPEGDRQKGRHGLS